MTMRLGWFACIAAGLMMLTPASAQPEIRAKLQVGPWIPATYNIEEPYINIIHASSVRWTGGDMDTQQLYDQGFLDPKTGLPTKLPGGTTLTSDVYFTTGRNRDLRTQWDGDWVLEWEVGNGGSADLAMLYINKNLQRRVGKNRVEFVRDAKNERTIYHAAIQVRNLSGGPLTALRLYRKENEAALKAGKIFNPRFIDAVSHYDVVRTMDLQNTNKTIIRSIDDEATLAAPFWGNAAWRQAGRIKHPFRAAPTEAMFALGVESGAAVWFQVPITLGMPVDFFDPAIVREGDGQWASAFEKAAAARADDIISSPEWDRYADAFVKGLIDSGYPPERPVYVALANEVWNFSSQYFLTTRYAIGLGEALGPKLGIKGPNWRHGYGILSARWKLALDAALKRAGRDQKVLYVIESQAAWVETTPWALEAAKRWLEAQGEDWDAHAGDFGVSVASYWSADWSAFAPEDSWPKLIADDPDGTARRFADFIIKAPASKRFGLTWVLEKLRRHEALARPYGVAFIGAYEGGPHLERPKYVDATWYRDFLWGSEGARVNMRVNEAVAEAFPGVILSNYGLAGAFGGQPWFEGPLGVENPYAESWKPWFRPAP